MSWRTVIIEGRCKLDYRMGYLFVRSSEVRRVFLDEIAILVIENPAVSFTGCLMEALIEKKVKVIFCDSKRNPFAELTPHHGCHDCSSRIKSQMAWRDETKAAVWQRIIRRKIELQASVLRDNSRVREADLLDSYLSQVEPGDVTNREGHAAKVYFNALFGMDFTRGADSPVNAALNYGYSILLSAVNREIAAMGYLTQLGVFHDNRFNAFNLSCDLMEPFRILVDRHVTTHMPERFEREEKRLLWDLLNRTVVIGNTHQTVLNALQIYLRSVIKALNEDTPGTIQFYEEV